MQRLSAIFPPGLDQRPRRVKLRAWSSGLGVWAIRLFILPHTIAGVGMIGWLLATITWAIFGTTQAAPVTMLDTYTSKGKTYYRTTYRYSVSGNAQTKESDISADEHARLSNLPEASRTIPVRVLAVGSWRYAEVCIGSAGILKQLGLVTLITVFWNCILSVFLWIAYVAPWRRRQLYRWGVPAPGVVTGIRISRGKSTTYYVEYRFITLEGAAHTGSHQVRKTDFDQAQPGMEVTVLHQEGRGKPSVVYEYGGYCVVPEVPALE